MKVFDLNEKIVFSPEKPIKRHFVNAKGFHAAIICLKKGIELKPHAEDYGVLLTVVEGKGTFTDSNGSFLLTKNQSIYIKKDEIRGIKPEEDLVVLGVQDRGKGMELKVIVYTSPVCTYCHIVKIFLKRNKIAFDEIDIEENKKAAEDLFRKTGTKTVPVTFVGDNFVVGYDQKK